MRFERLSSACCLALVIGGCPKRQTAPRVVYVPAPPAAAQPSEGSAATLVIEEPTPREPVEATPPKETSPAPKPATPRPHPPTPADPTPETVPPPPVEVPALVPRESPAQQAALRGQVLGTQEAIHGRIAQLERARLVGLDRKTLEDAKMFLMQSERALTGGDLQRSLNLARKASLLVQALEQQP